MFQQMMHIDHQHAVDEMMEEERDRRIHIMHDLADHEKVWQTLNCCQHFVNMVNEIRIVLDEI